MCQDIVCLDIKSPDIECPDIELCIHYASISRRKNVQMSRNPDIKAYGLCFDIRLSGYRKLWTTKNFKTTDKIKTIIFSSLFRTKFKAFFSVDFNQIFDDEKFQNNREDPKQSFFPANVF